MRTIETRDVPQANRLDKVSDLLALVDAGIKDAKELAPQLGLVRRELDYYKHAARILGFARFESGEFSLTDEGRVYLQVKTPSEKRKLLAEALKGAEVFSQLLQQYTQTELEKTNIADFLRERAGLSRTTAGRRADTILAWLKTTEIKR